QLNQLIEKYFQGHCTPEEEKVLWLWLWQLDLSNGEVFADAGQEVMAQQRMHRAIMERIGQPSAGGQPLQGQSKSQGSGRAGVVKTGFFRTASVAAAVVFFLTMAAVLFYRPGPRQPSSLPTVVLTNDGNHIKTVVLPDSSVVTLNLYASLEYKGDYGQKERR